MAMMMAMADCGGTDCAETVPDSSIPFPEACCFSRNTKRFSTICRCRIGACEGDGDGDGDGGGDSNCCNAFCKEHTGLPNGKA